MTTKKDIAFFKNNKKKRMHKIKTEHNRIDRSSNHIYFSEGEHIFSSLLFENRL